MHIRLARNLGYAVAGISILGLVIWYMYTHPAPEPYRGTATSTVPALNAKPERITENGSYYEIKASHPDSVAFPLSSTLDAGRNAHAVMEAWTYRTIETFKTESNFANLSAEDVQILGLSERKYTLATEYDVYAGPMTVSYVYTIIQDTGGAHPNTFYRTFTFDVTTGNELTISDLFLTNSDYLSELSLLARKDLPVIIGEYADDTFILDGTKPQVESFQNFYIENKTLTILFAPYQVGPYALGSVSLPIQLSRLSNLLKPEYR